MRSVGLYTAQPPAKPNSEYLVNILHFPLRSPACTNKGLRKKLTGGVNKGSTCLMRLFNRISEETHAPADTSIYSRTAFDGAFRDDFAIVASESSANPILTLDRDYDVTV